MRDNDIYLHNKKVQQKDTSLELSSSLLSVAPLVEKVNVEWSEQIVKKLEQKTGQKWT